MVAAGWIIRSSQKSEWAARHRAALRFGVMRLNSIAEDLPCLRGCKPPLTLSLDPPVLKHHVEGGAESGRCSYCTREYSSHELDEIRRHRSDSENLYAYPLQAARMLD